MKATFPLLLDGADEEATRFGKTFQSDRLESEWTRIDGFLGYPLRSWVNPYMGIRWSDFRQKRTNITVAGLPSSLSAAEEVKSWSLLWGVRGVGDFLPRWGWNYSLEYFLPLSVDVTNSYLPGFNASDRGGYTLNMGGGLDYLYNDSLSLGLLLYGGCMHWQGSDWQYTGRGLAKWPENDTYYLGVGLTATYGK